MSIAIQLIMLIFAVVISNLIATKIRSIPATFIYIAAGIILSFLPWFTNYVMAPEVFLFIIISVLMFNEGQHTNIRQLVHDFGRHYQCRFGYR
nr:cation:proton antiporter [Lentilactobacillus kosonis]